MGNTQPTTWQGQQILGWFYDGGKAYFTLDLCAWIRADKSADGWGWSS